MSSTTPTSSDRPSSSDANGGASSHFSQSPYGAVADKASSSANAMGGKSQAGSVQGTHNSGAQADGANSSAQSAEDAMHDLAEQAQQLCHDSMESMKTYIARHPVSSVGIAMAAGCVISMMLREGSSMRDHSRH